MRIIKGTLGFRRAATATVSAECLQCGTGFTGLVDDARAAAGSSVDHRCATGAAGALWSLTLPPPPAKAADIKPARRAKRAA